MKRLHGRTLFALGVALAVCAGPVFATTHLVSPGQSWPSATRKLRPGDEIVLLPGEHRPATLHQVEGEQGRPIVIRSADPRNPSVIRGGHIALQLSNCRHITVRDIVLAEATLCGLQMNDVQGDPAEQVLGTIKPGEKLLRDAGGIERSTDREARTEPGSIVLDSVVVRRIGTKGARHGVSIQHQADVKVINCTFEGWGGAAVEIVASRNVLVQQSVFTGLAECTQYDGIQVRAGSDDVRIEANAFRNAGVHAVRVGGRSKPGEFQPPLSEQPDTTDMGTHFESSRVMVVHNIIVGSECAVALSHARRCQVRHNTIVNPREMVFAAAREHDDPRFSDLDSCLILGNLVTWEPGSVSGLFLTTLPLRRQQVALDVNLWWTEDCNERHGPMTKFGIEGYAEQLWEINPLLDGRFRPRTDDAQLYGVPLDGEVQPRFRVASGG